MIVAARPRAKRGYALPALLPAVLLLGVVVLQTFLHEWVWTLGIPSLTRATGEVSFVVLMLTTNFGALYVYVHAYLRGAGGSGRIAAALATPIACIAFDVFRVSEFFSPAESLYYGLCPTSLSMLAANVGAMGLGEIACRLIARRSAMRVRVVTPGPLVALAFYAASFFVITLWGDGSHWFYIYMRGYVFFFA